MSYCRRECFGRAKSFRSCKQMEIADLSREKRTECSALVQPKAFFLAVGPDAYYLTVRDVEKKKNLV